MKQKMIGLFIGIIVAIMISNIILYFFQSIREYAFILGLINGFIFSSLGLYIGENFALY